MAGVLITIEGPDGAGKTTLIRGLVTELEAALAVPLMLTREPGGDPIAEKIREIILNPEHTALNDRAEALLYAASRAQHLEAKVLPAIKRGELVLCDRYIDSSLAYQGYGRQMDLAGIWQINQFATKNFQPDLTLYLDISAEEGIRRIQQNRFDEQNRLDKETIDFHRRVVEGYRQIAAKAGSRIVKIDATLSPGDLQKQALTVIKKRFPELFK